MIDAAPVRSTWVVAIHARADPSRPLGSGVVIDEHRVLTCAHVLGSRAAADLGIAFPRADDPYQPLARVKEIRASSHPQADLAVLELSGVLPAGIEPARLRRPKGAELVPKRWWAYGFPGGDPIGNDAHGTVGADLTFGWARLDTDSRYVIASGFSGGGVWSPDYEAVVGIVGQARDNGDGRALTLHMAVNALREERLDLLTDRFDITAAGDDAVSAWGWALASDSEAGRHWMPRSRGVTMDCERGYRFSGRRTVLTEIVTWLQRLRLDRKVLVVTGSPGVGKSAVLARIVTTADPSIAEKLPTTDTAIRAPIGSIACAVHAKGKTALQVGHEIARAASAPLPDHVADVVSGIRDALSERGDRRFTVVVDALDESVTAVDARLIIRLLLVPLVETCSDLGVQVLVGTRRRDSVGDLIDEFGGAHHDLDLDLPHYFAVEDLIAYAWATLQLIGDERPDNPYTNPEVAKPLARRIAEVAEPNFLVTGLVARTHGLHDQEPADLTTVIVAPTVTSAMSDFLARIPSIGGVSAADALLPLAFAYSPGLTLELWTTSVRALTGQPVIEDALYEFARGSAANFLVETTAGGGTYRLFHQALNDSLRALRAERHDAVADQQAIVRALLHYGQGFAWSKPPAYLLTGLPYQAAEANLVDELLEDVEYLVRVNPSSVMGVLDLTRTSQAGLTAMVYRASSGLHERFDTLARRQLLSIDAARYGAHVLASALAAGGGNGQSWGVEWATGSQVSPAAITTMNGHTAQVRAAACTDFEGRPIAVTAGDDGTVRVWDLAAGRAMGDPMLGHEGIVRAVACTQVNGRTVAVTAGVDGTVRVWDLAAGRAMGDPMLGHEGIVRAVACTQVNGRTVAVTAGVDGTVRVWDLASRTARGEPLTGHRSMVTAVDIAQLDDRVVAATSGHDGTIRLWDLLTGAFSASLIGPDGWVTAIACTQVDDLVVAVTTSDDWTVRLWDVTTGHALGRPLTGHNGTVSAVACTELDDRPVAVTVGHDSTVRVWNLSNGQQIGDPLTGHTGQVNAVACTMIGSRPVALTGGYDGTVRLWDLASIQTLANRRIGHIGPVNAAACVRDNDRQLGVTAGDDGTVRVWDLSTGTAVGQPLTGHSRPVTSVTCTQLRGRAVAITAGHDGTIRVWDLRAGKSLGEPLHGHSGWVRTVSCIELGNRVVAISAGIDGSVRAWDLTDGRAIGEPLTAGIGLVTALACTELDGRAVAVVCSGDTLRVWDLGIEQPVLAPLAGHTGPVTAVACTEMNGRTVAVTAGTDMTVRVWDLAESRAIGEPLIGHNATVTAVALTKLGGKCVAVTASNDATIRVWDLSTHRAIAHHPLPAPSSCISVAVDGSLLVGFGWDIALLTLKLPLSAEMTARVCL